MTAKLGEGGMGEVWRAQDMNLDREVAIKILPDEVASDPERMARFEREAKVLAALDHPNIASIYDLAEHEGRHLLVMQLVEGETLDELISRGEVPVDEAVKIAIQITEALESAHERSVVHRDLKPANIKIAPDGTVSVLDFGLAKIWDAEAESAELSFSPTLTAGMTRAGVILGTAAYMSPEQARGKPIDKRSDIWAFGVVLYEMLTGTGMYRGETVTDILGAIVHGRPDLEALPESAPASLRRLIDRCLEPDVRDRLRDIGEARYALTHLDDEPEAATEVAEAHADSVRGGGLWKAATVVLLVAAAGLAFLLWGRPREAPAVTRASLHLPAGYSLLSTGERGGPMRLSSDGSAVVFVGQEEGNRQIFIRHLGEPQARPVPGAETGQRPFWSPDGRSLGFFSDGKLRRISVDGGSPLAIADAPSGRGGLWLPDGTIIFSPAPGHALLAVSASGGEARLVTALSKDRATSSHREPRALPDGKHFLFLEDTGPSGWRIMVGDVDGGPTQEIGPTDGGAEFAQGHLLYLRERVLVAQPFDPSSFELSGEPRPIAEGIVADSNYGIGVFSASEAEVLVYQAGARADSEMVWVDRDGTGATTIGDPANYRQADLSPDGNKIVSLIDSDDGAADLWITDATTGSRRRFTITADNQQVRRTEALWSPDGSLIAFSAELGEEPYSIYVKRTDGTGGEELLLGEEGLDLWAYDFSPDGKWILYGRETRASSNEDLWIVNVSGEGEPKPLVETPFDEWPGAFSPDGRWLAYDSDETGRREIYVIPLGEARGKWQVSANGGRFPQWSPDGTELYYWATSGAVMAVSISGGSAGSFASSPPEELFRTSLTGAGSGVYRVHPSGDRFLLITQPTGEAPISLFLNWTTALRER